MDLLSFRFKTLVLVLTLLVFSPIVTLGTSFEEPSKFLPDRVGDFRGRGVAIDPRQKAEDQNLDPNTADHAARIYSSPRGATFLVSLRNTVSDSAAYALLTEQRAPDSRIDLAQVGTASTAKPRALAFMKGKILVRVEQLSGIDSADELMNLARGIAEKLAAGDNEIPVLVKHLPRWDETQPIANYVVDLEGLKRHIPGQAVLDAVSFEAGAEAVIANYPELNSGKLVIIEFTTPQHAGDNDRRIIARLNEIKTSGLAGLPTAYRRVGNYSVFVFNGDNEQAANNLINEIKYEQVTQWLGDNPYPFLEAQRAYRATTLGVLVSVVKASGIALVTCLTVGGLFGGLLFFRRRAQQQSVDAYSDAGGMMRLNLDELTPQTDAARLIGRGQ